MKNQLQGKDVPRVSCSGSPGVANSEVTWQTRDSRQAVGSQIGSDSCLAFGGVLLKSVTAKHHCNKAKQQLLWAEKLWSLVV